MSRNLTDTQISQLNSANAKHRGNLVADVVTLLDVNPNYPSVCLHCSTKNRLDEPSCISCGAPMGDRHTRKEDVVKDTDDDESDYITNLTQGMRAWRAWCKIYE